MKENSEVRIAGIGACVMDTLITVPAYPKEDTKLRAVASKAAGGGPAATGIVAAAKLGSKAGFLGVLAGDGSGAFLKADFEHYGVDVTGVELKSGSRLHLYNLAGAGYGKPDLRIRQRQSAALHSGRDRQEGNCGCRHSDD